MPKISVKFTKVVNEEMEIPDELYSRILPTKGLFGLSAGNDEEEEAICELYQMMEDFVDSRRDPYVCEDIQVFLGFTVDGENYDK